MPIEFRCPQCEKLLRVPDESAGAKAKCPQCGAIADVPQSEATNSGDQASPFSEGTQSLEPTARPTADEAGNPYRSPSSGFAPAAAKPSISGEIVPTRAEVGDVISYAWEVWKSNLGILLGITVMSTSMRVRKVIKWKGTIRVRADLSASLR